MIGRRGCLAVWLVGLPVATPNDRAQSVRPTPLRLALKGYDPVAYFTDGKPIPGKAEYEAAYDDVRYRFSSQRHLEIFKADPDRYAPQNAGSCAAGIAMGVKVEAEPENWLIVDDKLFVFAGAGSADEMRADPADMIGKGRENGKTLAGAPYRRNFGCTIDHQETNSRKQGRPTWRRRSRSRTSCCRPTTRRHCSSGTAPCSTARWCTMRASSPS